MAVALSPHLLSKPVQKIFIKSVPVLVLWPLGSSKSGLHRCADPSKTFRIRSLTISYSSSRQQEVRCTTTSSGCPPRRPRSSRRHPSIPDTVVKEAATSRTKRLSRHLVTGSIQRTRYSMRIFKRIRKWQVPNPNLPLEAVKIVSQLLMEVANRWL